VSKLMLLPDPCPACGAVELDSRMLSWHGTTPDGRPAGGVKLWVECAACGTRFGRGAGGVLTTPEAAAEYERQRSQELATRYRAVMDRRAREAAERAVAAGRAPEAEPSAAADGGGM
jgi:hypothetical protein